MRLTYKVARGAVLKKTVQDNTYVWHKHFTLLKKMSKKNSQIMYVSWFRYFTLSLLWYFATLVVLLIHYFATSLFCYFTVSLLCYFTHLLLHYFSLFRRFANSLFRLLNMAANNVGQSRADTRKNRKRNANQQDLPSKPKAQMASGQGSHWLIESPTMFIYL